MSASTSSASIPPRKQIIPTTAELGMGFFPSAPVQVDVGGATVFVLGVERFEKL